MQAGWSHCLRLLESANLQRGGPSDGGVTKSSMDHQAMKTEWELMKTLVQVTHEYGGQISAEETSSVLGVLLRSVKQPEFSVTNQSKVILRSWSEGSSARGVEFKAKVGDDEIEYQRLVFTAIGNLFARAGNTVQKDTWIVVVKMLRIMLESIVSTNLIEDAASSRCYAAVLRCAHLVLSDCKSSLEEHISGLVGALRVFFTYGLSNSGSTLNSNKGGQGSPSVRKPSSWQESSSKSQERGAYRPPHLRGKPQASRSIQVGSSDAFTGDCDGQGAWGGASSDSEQSDSDAHHEEGDRFKSSKVRTNAILTIQAIARADPKVLHAHWVVLLPTQDVLQPRPYQATLLTVLLFDPLTKARMAAASTLAVMLEGPARAFLQVAEHRDIARSNSFTTLSSSLGQLVIQLHIGLVHVISNEAHGGIVVGALKSLSLLVSASPYTRLPHELLPYAICSVHRRARELFFTSVDQSNMMCAAINCLGAALGSNPPSAQVAASLIVQAPAVSSSWAPSGESPSCSHLLLPDLVAYTQLSAAPVIRVEAFQALKAAVHTYPSVVAAYWEPISNSIVAAIEHANYHSGLGEAVDPYSNPQNVRKFLVPSVNGQIARLADDKVVHSAIKLLDEFLRAASGYKGTDELLDDGPFQTPSPFFVPNPLRLVAASGLFVSKHGPDTVHSEIDSGAGVALWLEALNKHLPTTLSHSAPMVRGAALTCFAGLTSAIFCSLPDDKQDYVLSALIYAAWKDDTPAVRSAACRAIGVVVGFPQVAGSKEKLELAVEVVVSSTTDSSVSVRITASWALANICDALRSIAESKDELSPRSPYLAPLAECALRAAKDCDKVRANAVRALGNLARFADFSGQTEAHMKRFLGLNRDVAYQGAVEARRWLDVMVQTLVSCVTTGNVKVQWNVCHALGNLFLNKTINLSTTTWVPSVYSILLLLLRDSANYKIRIHAASALAVPGDREDYGESFTDVVKALVHALECTDSEHESAPTSFKYVKALTEQLTTTVVHVLGLSKPDDFMHLKDFLLKRIPFLAEFFKTLCTSVGRSRLLDTYNDETGLLERMAEVSISEKADSKTVAYDEMPLPPPKENRRYGLQMEDTATSSGGLAQKVKDLRRAIRAVAEMYRFGEIANVPQRLEMLLA
ncbi:HEAT repeat-containing protein 6 [Marchantia polymorpha subsp. ruderalis]|uniref:DUF4042 domain-containing protein n=2 Tax=Marchantia polymorpha TaxID=3197 RepID=A0AAF6AMK6_MARPO|nr:hypothetical protein MARPO_0043s0141 [Marchantia polymorpha]BBM97676.1 hypothetical protein Mp_1g07480 [Marchantia polymorpha subsp. ruderalis]|eukprot:PTQ39919.1 hypothetical protein MARPO_0043s0141 [Marchantia polymorpha]